MISYHVHHLFGIIYSEKHYFHFCTWTLHWTARISVKPSIQRNMPLGSLKYLAACNLTYCSIYIIFTGRYSQMEIFEVINSHHKIIILDNVAILLNLFTHFGFDPVLYHSYTEIASYHILYTHSFLLPQL